MCQGKLTHWVLLHNDNAPAHTYHVALVAMHEGGFEIFSQPPYFADLVPSDFEMSRYLKESLYGCASDDDGAVVMAIKDGIEKQDYNFFCGGSKDGKSVLISEGIVFKNN